MVHRLHQAIQNNQQLSLTQPEQRQPGETYDDSYFVNGP
jgi:hypothetical protein